MDRRLELTEDGSHTLYVPLLDEHYHSIHGAIQESQHVFINSGLAHCCKNKIDIFEVGFGTGLNALLSAQYAINKNTKIHYTTIELNPLSVELVSQLNYIEIDELYFLLHQAEWGIECKISDSFYLTKIEADLTQFNFSRYTNKFDLIYYDAFSPDVQDSMWSQELFDTMFNICKREGMLTTYCAKGAVRRKMQASGFNVERIPGPPGKREILRATKP